MSSLMLECASGDAGRSDTSSCTTVQPTTHLQAWKVKWRECVREGRDSSQAKTQEVQGKRKRVHGLAARTTRDGRDDLAIYSTPIGPLAFTIVGSSSSSA